MKGRTVMTSVGLRAQGIVVALGLSVITVTAVLAGDTDPSGSSSPTTQKPQTAPSADANKGSTNKPKKTAKDQTASTEQRPLKAGQYATEADARSHCQGTVVWVDSDNFNHYKGSREYGRKPGAFACEN
jgi:heme-binding NEAT domain protein